ncbi:hypothetical protein ACLOAV_008265 [Pseudogymnoascus australis]
MPMRRERDREEQRCRESEEMEMFAASGSYAFDLGVTPVMEGMGGEEATETGMEHMMGGMDEVLGMGIGMEMEMGMEGYF